MKYLGEAYKEYIDARLDTTNWDAVDGEPGFIRNKPFGNLKETVYLDFKGSVPMEPGAIPWTVELSDDLTIGDHYTVQINDITIDCVCVGGDQYAEYYLIEKGPMTHGGDPEWTGFRLLKNHEKNWDLGKFQIIDFPSSFDVYFTLANLKITRLAKTQIDWNANETEDGYIANKPFGISEEVVYLDWRDVQDISYSGMPYFFDLNRDLTIGQEYTVQINSTTVRCACIKGEYEHIRWELVDTSPSMLSDDPNPWTGFRGISMEKNILAVTDFPASFPEGDFVLTKLVITGTETSRLSAKYIKGISVDWNAQEGEDGYIANKPDIKDGVVDWDAQEGKDGYIANKPFGDATKEVLNWTGNVPDGMPGSINATIADMQQGDYYDVRVVRYNEETSTTEEYTYENCKLTWNTSIRRFHFELPQDSVFFDLSYDPSYNEIWFYFVENSSEGNSELSIRELNITHHFTKKIDGKYLPPPDWKAEKGEEGYITNKPFGNFKKVTCVNWEGTNRINYDDRPWSFNLSKKLVVGNHYTVKINDVLIDCICTEGDEYIECTLIEDGLMSLGGDEGWTRFLANVLKDQPNTLNVGDWPSSFDPSFYLTEFQITGTEKTQIDWDARITEDGYIANKPFGVEDVEVLSIDTDKTMIANSSISPNKVSCTQNGIKLKGNIQAWEKYSVSINGEVSDVQVKVEDDGMTGWLYLSNASKQKINEYYDQIMELDGFIPGCWILRFPINADVLTPQNFTTGSFIYDSAIWPDDGFTGYSNSSTNYKGIWEFKILDSNIKKIDPEYLPDLPNTLVNSNKVSNIEVTNMDGYRVLAPNASTLYLITED